ncbi:MAG: peptidylprolyl isomerase, partial [Myxococcota bacterium]
MTRSPLLVSLAVASAFACSKPSEAPKPADGKAAPTAAPQVKDDGTGPAAIVNGIEVSRELFKREFDQTMDRYKKARHEVRPGLKERLKDNIVRRLVDMEVIRQQAEKMKVALTDEEKNLRWTEHRKRYGTDEAFKAFLERAGTTEEDIRRQFNANLLREKVFSKVASTVEVADDDIRKFYDDNVSRYTEPEQVKARHILLRKPNNATPEQIKEVKAKAATVLKKVKRKGADFAALAKKYSEDVTKNRGGELGWFAKGRMVKAFETAAWQLK